MTVSMDERSYMARQLELHGLPPNPLLSVRDTLVRIGSVQIHLREWGTPSTDPVVFLHGGGGSARDWDAICASMSSRRFCVAVDQRGHGDSDWSPDGDYRLATFAADIEGLADSCGWESVRLVGFSMGGMNALAAAAAFGERCRALVLVEAAPRLRDDPAVENLRRRLVAPTRYASLDEAIVRRDPGVDLALARAYQERRLRRAPDGLWGPKHDPRLLNGAGTRETADEREAPLWRAVARVRCPVLVVRGGRNSLLDADAAAGLASRFADGTLIEIGALPHRISPPGAPQLVEALESFLEARDEV